MSLEDFKDLLRAYIGDRTDDETLALLEGLDSLAIEQDESAINELKASLEAMTNAREETEREWRERYRDRFFGTGAENADVEENKENEENEESEVMTADEAGKLWLEENGKHFR